MSKGRFLIVMIGLWLISAIASAKVSVFVDQNPVMQGQTVTLTVRLEGQVGQPELEPLLTDFKILSQSTNSQTQVINGKASSWKDWNIQLLPRRSGTLEIPSLQVGQTWTQPIGLTVSKQAAGGTQEAWLEWTANPKQVWQGQQILVEINLFYQSSVRTGDLSPPEIQHAVAERLGDDITRQTQRNGMRVNQLTRRYVVFPEQAGEFLLGTPVFNGQAESRQAPRTMFGGLFRNTRSVAAVAEDLRVNVLPAQAQAGEFWLPASQVSLSAKWLPDEKGQTSAFKVGQPVTREVTLSSKGLLSTQLPELEFSAPGLRSYSENSEQANPGTSQGVMGQRIFRTVYIPQQPGQYTLPAVNLPWWDVTSGQRRMATLPAETIVVTGAPQQVAAVPDVATDQPEPDCAPLAEAGLPAKQEQVGDSGPNSPMADNLGRVKNPWFWGFIASLLLWLGSCLLWLKKRRRSPQKQASTAAIFKAKKQLEKAAKASHVAQAAAALKALAVAAKLPATTAGALADKVHSPDLAAALRDLDAAQYGGQPWDGRGLLTALQQHSWPLRSEPADTGLPPLYPS